jgi:acetyl-CoA acyltransferase
MRHATRRPVEQRGPVRLAGHYEVVVVGGVETMSRVPLGAARATGMPYGPAVLDEYAAASHAKAFAAASSGAFTDEIVPAVRRKS